MAPDESYVPPQPPQWSGVSQGWGYDAPPTYGVPMMNRGGGMRGGGGGGRGGRGEMRGNYAPRGRGGGGRGFRGGRGGGGMNQEGYGGSDGGGYEAMEADDGGDAHGNGYGPSHSPYGKGQSRGGGHG